MKTSLLDHLVLVAPTLAEGVAYCEAMLGVRPPVGGEHAAMGTHNHLLKLGAGTYLEVIAINPVARAPARARWFGMDAANATHPARTCRLATFVVRSSDVAAAVDALPMLGPVCPMQRGALQWKITIPDDGNLLDGGTMPSVIEWPAGVDPAGVMPDQGCRLARLEVFHPAPDRLAGMWAQVGLHPDERLNIKAIAATVRPYLVAYVETPTGMKILSGMD